MREHSTPSLGGIPTSARLSDVVADRAERSPASVALRRRAGAAPGGGTDPGAPGDWEDVTARQFRDEVVAMAKGLIAAGVEPGDRVALLSRTRYEWTLVDYAIWTAGAVTVPIYETSSPEQAEWILSDSGARAVVLETPSHHEAIADVLGRLATVERTWLIEGGATGRPGDGALADAGQTPPPPAPLASLAAEGHGVTDDEVERRRTSRVAADLATIIYTSGTTGRPKGCQITHANLLADVRGAIHGPLSPIFEIPGASTLLFLPLAHSFARVIEVGCLEAGATLGHSPDVARLLPDLASFRPTFVLAVPRVFEKVYNGAEQQAGASRLRSAIFRAAARTAVAWSQSMGAGASRGGVGLRAAHALFDRLVYAKLRAAMGGRISYAVSGGAPLGERLGHFFRGAGLTIIEGYGLTETSPAVAVNSPDRNKIGTVGRPLPGVSVRIDDDGEILVAGPIVFPGYWRNEPATSEILGDGGWLRSGDLGELDDEGFLRVTGRKKELIVTAGGKNVQPAVLEDSIRAHPLVSQCMVVGDSRPYVACLVTLDEEALGAWKQRHSRPASDTADDVKDDPELLAEIQRAVDEANKAVSRAEAIKRFRVLGADFTEESGHLTPSMKVRKNAVSKDFAADIDALYS